MKQPTALKLAFLYSERTQREVAAEVGIDPATLSRIVNGWHADDDTQAKIARALGKTIQECFASAVSEAKAA